MDHSPTRAPLKVCGLVGSLRSGSFNRSLMMALPELFDEPVAFDLPDIARLPHYNDDVRLAAIPAEVEAFAASVAASDALVFATPEYNRSIPGVLKNAIDWLSKHPNEPLKWKVAAVTGASRGTLGTIMANHHLRQILVYVDVTVVTGPEVLVPNAAQKFDDAGRLTDEPTRAALAKMLARLAMLARQRAR